jgi:hypothetical protein
MRYTGITRTRPMRRQRRCPKAGGKNLPPGDAAGVSSRSLDSHDLAIAKYVARRDKDIVFDRELATRGIVRKEQLLPLLDATTLDENVQSGIRDHIERDFR